NILQTVSAWILPLLIISILLFGYLKGIKIYETVTTGAKDGFDTAVRIIPFLVAVFVAIGMIKASGAMELFIKGVTPLTSLIGMPPEALPMAFMRPLSGSGALGVMSEVVKSAPDSFGSFVVSTMQGSTETTFYVLAVYFGSIGIKRIRYALYAGLIADLAGILATVFISRFFFFVVF
ncbi:MAG: spore maturation protein, partial [Chitinivibrionales bacterium]